MEKTLLSPDEITFSQLTGDFIPAIVKLLETHQITFQGFSDSNFLTNVMTDAVSSNNPIVMIATTPSLEIIGWTIVIRNSRQYWKQFMLSHPYYALKIIIYRFTDKFLKNETVTVPIASKPEEIYLVWPINSSVLWGESNNNIARSIDTTVNKDYRRLGVAQGLRTELFKVLKSFSVSRIDASPLCHNLPSIRWHIKEGWSLVKTENGVLYITKEI